MDGSRGARRMADPRRGWRDVPRPRLLCAAAPGCGRGPEFREFVAVPLRLQAGNASLRARIDAIHAAERLPSPDRVPRKEVYERSWGVADLGEISLTEGEHLLEAQLEATPHREGFELKAIELVKQQ